MIVAVAAIAVQHFRYERTLLPAGKGPALVVADAPMLAHARQDFADVRVIDAGGEQVPWRQPVATRQRTAAVALLDVGRRGAAAVARFAGDGVVDRIVLAVPDRRFHGSVTVYGSDDRRTWTRLSTTEIYSVGGASPARSTTALIPRSDFRWYELRATGVTRIDGASVEARGPLEQLLPLPGTFTRGTLDLHYRVPVVQLRIGAATPRYSRPFRVETATGSVVASGVLVRTGRPRATVVPLQVSARRLRIVVENGDNPPLQGLRVQALGQVRTLIVEGGHAAPLRLYYGARVRAPQYDFARLPFRGSAKRAALGAETPNPQYAVVDTRSFFARHRSLVTLALALAAVAVLGAATLALRRT